MDEREVTFVFQGPEVIVDGENTTLAGIKRTREIFPESPIIFSTWAGVNTLPYIGLKVEIVLSEDPGSTYRDKKNNLLMNLNRQLKSSAQGISRVSTLYSVKLRSDLFPLNRNVLDCLDMPDIGLPRNDEYKFTTKRVLVLDVTSIDPRLEEPLPFHPCDWLYAGLTTDLEIFFPLDRSCDEKTISEFYEYNIKPVNNPFPSSSARYHSESWIFVEAMRVFKDFNFDHVSDLGQDNIALSEKLIFNNLCIVSLRKIGFKSAKHNIQITNYSRTYTTKSWKALGDTDTSGRGLINLRYIVARFMKINSLRIRHFKKIINRILDFIYVK